MNDYVASSGTLVGAALQSAGYYYQSWALDALTQPFKGLYFLVYVVAALISLTSFVVSGRVKNIYIFLIGPVFFAAIINERTESAGVEWRYGKKVYSEERVQQRVATMTPDPAYIPRVSSVFARYDAIVSSFVQSVIAALNKSRTDADLKLLVRAELYGFMMNQELTDTGTRDLVQVSLLGDCRALITAGREMADVRNTPPQRCEHAKKFERIAMQSRTQLTPATAQILAHLKVLHPNLYDLQSSYSLETEIAQFQNGLTSEYSQTCDIGVSSSVPGTSGAVNENPSQIVTAIVKQNMRQGENVVVQTSDEVERSRQALAGREIEIQQAFNEISGKSYSCHEIWNITYKLLHFQAGQTKEAMASLAKQQGFKEEDIMKDMTQLSGQPFEQDVLRTIARKFFRNETQNKPLSSIIATYQKAGSNVAQIGIPGDDAAYMTEKEVTRQRELAEKYGLLAKAAALPYYQGVFLYFLAVVFPFFAMLLLVPGRFTGFLVWFGLWFWLKSWDIGFAIAAFIDDALFALFTSQLTDPVAARGLNTGSGCAPAMPAAALLRWPWPPDVWAASERRGFLAAWLIVSGLRQGLSGPRPARSWRRLACRFVPILADFPFGNGCALAG